MADLRNALAGFRGEWKQRHLLGTEGLSREEIQAVLDCASEIKSCSAASRDDFQPLKNKTVALLFVEPSTRTKLSFGLAARALGAHTLDFSPAFSSLTKGESLKDTARTIEAMGVDAFVVRHSASGAAQHLSRLVGKPVLNAGDGTHEHPTQALADLLTMREALGQIEGLHVAVVGDVLHSRVARSNYYALTKLGARVTCVGPSSLLPQGWDAEVSTDLDAVLPDADVVMMLRIQFERGANVLELSEYRRRYELTRERLSAMKDGSIIMHPGPLNRDIELCAEAADSSRSRILNQVANGVPVRTALLYLYCSEEPRSWKPSSSRAAKSSTPRRKRARR